MYFTYVLKSKKYNRLYIGYSEDIQKRLKTHNRGKVKSTKHYRPYELVYYESYEDKGEAREREIFLKSGQGKKFLEEKITNWRGGRAV